jgi:hypothetical protein
MPLLRLHLLSGHPFAAGKWYPAVDLEGRISVSPQQSDCR